MFPRFTLASPRLGLRGWLLAALLAGPLSADLVPLQLTYHRINLANGRILKDVTLNGFNRESGLIYVLEDHRLRPYPVALFPGFVTDRVDALAAEVPSPTARDAHRPTPDAPSRAAVADNRADLAAAREDALLDAVAAKAHAAVRRHLAYQIKIGSGYATVIDVDIDLDPPESVPGWTHRYRVRGQGYYSYYESVGSFNRRSRGVEVLLEAPSPTRIKVLEVNTTWGSAR